MKPFTALVFESMHVVTCVVASLVVIYLAVALLVRFLLGGL